MIRFLFDGLKMNIRRFTNCLEEEIVLFRKGIVFRLLIGENGGLG